jgi:hypothetical protein
MRAEFDFSEGARDNNDRPRNKHGPEEDVPLEFLVGRVGAYPPCLTNDQIADLDVFNRGKVTVQDVIKWRGQQGVPTEKRSITAVIALCRDGLMPGGLGSLRPIAFTPNGSGRMLPYRTTLLSIVEKRAVLEFGEAMAVHLTGCKGSADLIAAEARLLGEAPAAPAAPVAPADPTVDNLSAVPEEPGPNKSCSQRWWVLPQGSSARHAARSSREDGSTAF